MRSLHTLLGLGIAGCLVVGCSTREPPLSADAGRDSGRDADALDAFDATDADADANIADTADTMSDAGDDADLPYHCGSGASSIRSFPDGFEITTDHYVVYVEAEEARARELATMLESAYHGFAAVFLAEPTTSPLRVEVLADEASYDAALARAGAPAAFGGTYFAPARTVFVSLQPTRFYTRQVLLHEAAHQFHYLSRTGNRAPPSLFYREGIADHLAHHVTRDGCVWLGASPLLTPDDFPLLALRQLLDSGSSLSAVAEGSTFSFPSAFAVIRFLAQDEEAFVSLMGSLDTANEEDALAEVLARYGTVTEANARYASWLADAGQLEFALSESVNWDGLSEDGIDSWSAFGGIARARSAPSGLGLTVTPPIEADRWFGGVVTGTAEARANTTIEVGGDGRVYEKPPRQNRQPIGDAPPLRDGGYRFELDLARAVVTINGEEFPYNAEFPPVAGISMEGVGVSVSEVRLGALDGS